MRMKRAILITGGARSGKSRFAQELALKLGGPVLFVATAEAGDEEMKQRIEEHRRERPADWDTLEVTTHICSHIRQRIGGARVVVVDCITLLVNNIFSQYSEQIDAHFIEEKLIAEINELEKTEIEVKKFSRFKELFPGYLFFALGLIVSELVLTNTRFRKIP